MHAAHNCVTVPKIVGGFFGQLLENSALALKVEREYYDSLKVKIQKADFRSPAFARTSFAGISENPVTKNGDFQQFWYIKN